MKTFGKFGVLLCIWLLSFVAHAQRNADVVIDFETDVQDLIVVPFNGLVLISDNQYIYGYQGDQTEKPLWKVEIPKRDAGKVAVDFLADGNTLNSLWGLNKNANGPDFSVIPNTPLIQKFFDKRLYVINSFNGEMVFDSEGNTFFYQSEYLADEAALLLRGVRGNNLVIAKYDIKGKKYLWDTVVSKQFSSMFNKAFQHVTKVESANEMKYSKDFITLQVNSNLYVLDKQKGDVLWKDETLKFTSFIILENAKLLSVADESGMMKWRYDIYLRDLKSGKDIWKEPIRTKKIVLLEDWEDRLLVAEKKSFNFYDYKTGKKVWKKSPKGKGIKSVISIDQDFLYAYDEEMMLVDKNGKKKWRKEVKVCDDKEDPIYFLEKTNNGRVLFVTSKFANLVDYKSGKKIWKKNIKLNEKRPIFAKFDQLSGDFVIYNDEKLYRFNEGTGKRPKPYAKVRLAEEKLLTGIDIFPSVVTIIGQSDVVGVDNNGEVKFQNKYSQPGEFKRKSLKFGLGFLSDASSVASAEISVSSGGQKVYKGNAFDNDVAAMGSAGLMTTGFAGQFVKDRFDALQQTDTYALLFAKSDSGGKMLVKIDKTTGKEVDKVELESDKPVYDYDSVSKNIYYSVGNQVRIFNGK